MKIEIDKSYVDGLEKELKEHKEENTDLKKQLKALEDKEQLSRSVALSSFLFEKIL